MKKFFILLAFLPLVFCVSCSKDRSCHCVTTEAEVAQETIINTDRGMKCSKITRLGTERQIEGHLVRSYDAVKCDEL